MDFPAFEALLRTDEGWDEGKGMNMRDMKDVDG